MSNPIDPTVPSIRSPGNAGEASGTRSNNATPLDTPMPDVPYERDEDLAAIAKQLEDQLKARKLRQHIEDLRAELAGGTPAQPMRLESDLAVRTKRPAEESLEWSRFRTSFKTKPPSSYKGKSLKEFQDYQNSWALAFQAEPDIPDSLRIAKAATSLEDIAAAGWLSLEQKKKEDILTWDDYMAWCKGIIVDPVNRMHTAFLKLKTVEQRSGQSSRELYNYVINLLVDLPPMTEEVRNAWIYLNALNPQLRRDVMKEQAVITSMEQVLASAQRQEELTPSHKSKPEPKDQRNESQSSRGGSARRYRTPRGQYKGKETQRTEGSHSQRKDTSKQAGSSSVVCYSCDKPGHYSRDCPSKQSGSTLDARVTHSGSKK